MGAQSQHRTLKALGADKGTRVLPSKNYDPKLVEAAAGLEAQFLEKLIEEMRKSIPESELTPKSEAEKIYQSMLDGEYANKMANAGGIGLSRLIIEQLAGK